MSDYAELRKLAEANPERWFYGAGDRHYSEDETFLLICADEAREVPIIFIYAGDDDEEELDERFATRAAYIAAAHPQTVLALIERLERAEAALREIEKDARRDLPDIVALRMIAMAAREALEPPE